MCMRGWRRKSPEAEAPGFATGDGNRTRVSCLGSTRPTIERRPHVVRADSSAGVRICQAKREKYKNVSHLACKRVAGCDIGIPTARV